MNPLDDDGDLIAACGTLFGLEEGDPIPAAALPGGRGSIANGADGAAYEVTVEWIADRDGNRSDGWPISLSAAHGLCGRDGDLRVSGRINRLPNDFLSPSGPSKFDIRIRAEWSSDLHPEKTRCRRFISTN